MLVLFILATAFFVLGVLAQFIIDRWDFTTRDTMLLVGVISGIVAFCAADAMWKENETMMWYLFILYFSLSVGAWIKGTF